MSVNQRWAERHARIVDFVTKDDVRAARSRALSAAQKLVHNDDTAASALAANQASQRIIDESSNAEQLSIEVDESLAVLWSAPKQGVDPCQARRDAMPSLAAISSTHLTDSSRDLSPLASLESNSLGTVEVVRCRMDRKIYVLKSMTKGAAKRCYKTTSPMTERRLLAAARDEKARAVAPKLVASFQSPASLHIVLEYCPAGDLYNFLESAGQADLTNEARNPSGGLLAERYIRSYARDMVAAIAWLHDCGFMHRDIKPGNWLFDRSGHLLLCDLASAAPFSTFRNIPSSATLAELDAAAAPAEQRRILYRHCTLVGTADYIAPEVFWAAEMLGARASRLNESTRLEDTVEDDAGEGRDDDDDDDEPPPDGPGPHGPECDWWSVGVVIFEMTYKRLPFFAKGVAQTYDMIKNHERHFHLDTWVKCSPDLKDLLCRLITGPQQRLGFFSSREVQSHPYFANVDWNKPWEGDAAPFIPNVESFSDGSASSHLQEISVLHSPGHKTPYRGLDPDTASSIRSRPDFAAMWAGDSSDFPAFPNSVDLSPRGAASMPPTANDEVTEDQGDDTTVTVTSSSPSARAHAHVLARAADPKADELSSESTSLLEAQWSNFDPLWIGFSYVPDRDAFAAADDELGLSSPARPSPLSSPLGEGFKSPDVAEQWTWQPHAAPTASTPYHKATEPYATILPTPLPMPVSTPYHGTVPRSLHRHAIETASRTKGGTDAAGRPFVTPLRKNSLPNISSASAAFHTPMPTSDPTRRTPASPYPFPLAPSVSRPRATPAVASLKRNDLERARSASASYGATSGEGSDSRCSGGTNAKRDISEREAWKEMEAAVLRSVRKPRQAAVTHAAAPVASRRPPMVHAATDTVLQKQDLVTGSSGGSSGVISTSLADRAERKEAGATSQAPGRLMRKASAFGFGGLGGALRAKRPQLPRFLSDRTSKQQEKQPQLAPLDTSLRSPMRKGDRRASAAPIASPASSTASDTTALSSSTIDSSQASPSSSRLRFFPQRSKSSTSSSGTGDAPATSSSSSLAVPGMPKLQKRRSARQLLLKAQERATPTKPTRALSPLMSGPISLDSQGDRSAEASGSSSNHQLPPASGSTSSLPVLGGPLAPQLVGQGRRKSVTDAGGAAPQSSSDDVISSPTAPRSSKQLPRMPASAPVGQVLVLQREETTRTMRRRDSREMLSRYRQGIPTSDDEDEGQKSEDTRKGANKKLPTLRHQTSSSTVSVGGVGGVGVGGGGGATITLSSPSLPTFPDAFGGAPAAQDENHIPSSSSVGLSRRTSGLLNTNTGKPMRRSSMIPLVARPAPEATRAKGPSPLQHPHPQGGVKARSSTDFTFMKDKREETLAAARRPFEKTNSYDAKALAAKRAGNGPLASRFSAANVLPPESISSAATSQQARRWKEKAASSEDVEELGGELGDESGAMEGLGMRHRALQTSLDGVEGRLMRLKLRLRDE